MGRSSKRLCSDIALRRALPRPLLAFCAALLSQLLWLSPIGGQDIQPPGDAASSSSSDTTTSSSADVGLPGAAGLPGPPSEEIPEFCPSKPWYSCCGAREYDPFNATCCNGFLVVGMPFAACCGRLAYNVDQQGCCNGRVVERSVRRGPLACCGTTGYDPTTYTCCGSTVMQRSPVMACCGGQPYFFPEPIGPLPDGTTGAAIVGDAGALPGPPADGSPGSPSSSPGSVVCCGCRLYNVKGQRGQGSCCGEVPYDRTTQLCCNGAVHSIVGKQSPRCCGAALVDESTSTSCCQGRAYRYGPFGPLCCPDGTLNSCCFFPQSNRTACI